MKFFEARRERRRRARERELILKAYIAAQLMRGVTPFITDMYRIYKTKK